MSRDYKSPSKSTPKKAGNPLLTGLLIGLFIGLASAVGVALYINRMPSPFSERNPPAADAPAEKAAIAAPDNAAETPTATQGKAPSKPRFDFYNILPGSEEPISEQNLKQQAQQAPGEKEAYFLQAGAFQSGADADNLKAKLALLGVEAVIQTVNLPDKGIWHRVRIGPYVNIEEASNVKATLAQNKVDASVIKVKEAPQ
jgi:cell division protein FtsN